MRTALSRKPLCRYFLRSLFLFPFLCFSSYSFGQLTHVQAELSIDSNLVANDSVTAYVKHLVATITPNDLADFGKISVVVYNTLDQSIVCDEIVKTKGELITQGLLNGSSFILRLCSYREGDEYEIVFSPETLSGAFVEINQVRYPF